MCKDMFAYGYIYIYIHICFFTAIEESIYISFYPCNIYIYIFTYIYICMYLKI